MQFLMERREVLTLAQIAASSSISRSLEPGAILPS